MQKKDEKDNLLVYVWVLGLSYDEGKAKYIYNSEDISNRLFLNAEIIKQGYAAVKVERPNIRYAVLFPKLHQEAKENERGLWSSKTTYQAKELQDRLKEIRNDLREAIEEPRIKIRRIKNN